MRGKRHFQNMEEMGGRQEMIKGKKDSGMEGKELLQRGSMSSMSQQGLHRLQLYLLISSLKLIF